jgi:hypothetical protein
LKLGALAGLNLAVDLVLEDFRHGCAPEVEVGALTRRGRDARIAAVHKSVAGKGFGIVKLLVRFREFARRAAVDRLERRTGPVFGSGATSLSKLRPPSLAPYFIGRSPDRDGKETGHWYDWT